MPADRQRTAVPTNVNNRAVSPVRRTSRANPAVVSDHVAAGDPLPMSPRRTMLGRGRVSNSLRDALRSMPRRRVRTRSSRGVWQGVPDRREPTRRSCPAPPRRKIPASMNVVLPPGWIIVTPLTVRSASTIVAARRNSSARWVGSVTVHNSCPLNVRTRLALALADGLG